ncbi:MAG: hypothetical protein WHS38_00300 [Thermodesulforhabdaceae bacterium]
MFSSKEKNYYALLIYFILTMVFWGAPLKFDFINSLHIAMDPAFYLWSFKWWPYALSHGLNPFLTKAFWAPFGQNLAWTTSCPSITIMLWPITNLFGPIFSYHFITIISLALAPYGIYLINKQLDLKKINSFIGGLIFFFSSYVWGQLLGHLNLYVIFAIPFFLYLTVLRLKRSIGSKRYVILSALLLAFQFGISNEIYATFVLFGFFALFVSFLIFINDENCRKLIFKIFLESVLIILISIILLSPYLYFVFYEYVKEQLNSPHAFSADPLNYLIPTPITMLFGDLFKFISVKFTGNFSEEGAYLGLPLIFIVVSFFAKSFSTKNKFYIFLSIMFCVILIFSFGPYLRILNYPIIPMPWYLFTKLPLIHQALPTRFTLYTSMITAIMAAIWLEKTNISIKLKYFVAILAIIFLIPNLNVYRGHKITYPAFLISGQYKDYIKSGENVIIFPTYVMGGFQGPLWQQRTDFYFNVSQGFAGPIPSSLKEDKNVAITLYKLIYGKPTHINDPLIYSFIHYLIKCDVRAILLPDSYHNKILDALLKSLDIEPIHTGGVILYKVDKEQLLSKTLPKYHEKIANYYVDIFENLFTSSQKFLLDGGSLSSLIPQYLEEHSYLDKSFGYQTGKAVNWTQNGGWIGKWGCPDRKGECFGVGIVGDVDMLKPIIDKYKSQSLQIFFPYPKTYTPDTKETNGQLLMIFRAPKPDNAISQIPYTIDFRAGGNAGRFINSGFCNPENWGTWSCAKEALLSFRLKEVPRPLYLKLHFHTLTTPNHFQRIQFYLNGNLLKEEKYTDSGNKQLTLDVSNLIQQENILLIKVPDAATPKSLGINTDRRELGIGMVRLEISPDAGDVK